MKNIKSNNLIGISAIIIALVIGYYFVLYLPEKNNQIVLSQNIQKCAELGAKEYQEELKSNASSYLSNDPINPTYKYNKKLNTCLYKITKLTSYSSTDIILDLYTNNTLASYTQLNDNTKWAEDQNIKLSDFTKKSSELFKD